MSGDDFASLMRRYFEYERGRGYVEGSLHVQRGHLQAFFAWCAERDLTRPVDVTRTIIERYPRFVLRQPLATATMRRRISVVRGFFRFLVRQNLLLHNPASEIEIKRGGTPPLPKNILSAKEAELVLAVPDVDTLTGIRDRAILETLYSTGLRRAEITKLSTIDVDKQRGYVMVREGKGKKDRVVPIGARALVWIEKYTADVRPSFVAANVADDDGALFLSEKGTRISPNHLTDLARGYVERSGIGKAGACHLFRHTAATLMLEGGAEIRFIQAMLGHESIATTQIYTKVAIRKLKEVHERTHPAESPRTSTNDEPSE